MSKTDEKKKSWEKAWEEREKALKNKLEICQIMIEKTKIDRDLDLLFNEIENRKQTAFTSHDNVQQSINNYHVVAENMRVKITNKNFNFVSK